MAEQQAIAIYETEIAILTWTAWTHRRKKSLKICFEILAEERKHLTDIEVSLERREIASVNPWLCFLNRGAGWGIGSLLAFLPSKFSWYLHSLAEEQAAQIYDQAILDCADHRLATELRNAARQERGHSQRFKQAEKG